MQLNTIIIDDEPLARELIKSYIDRFPMLKLTGSYISAADAVKSVISGDVDLIFLDINMPCVNGIELAQITPPKTRIVYVTAYEEYALQAFGANALDYLLKPLSFEHFSRAVSRAIEWKKMELTYSRYSNCIRDCLIVKSDYKTVQIPFDEIIYIEGRRDYVHINISEPPYKYLCLLNLKRLGKVLPPDRFMRVHRSFMVNLSKIRVVDRGFIVFGEERIPISEAYKDRFSGYLKSHSIAGLESSKTINF